MKSLKWSLIAAVVCVLAGCMTIVKSADITRFQRVAALQRADADAAAKRTDVPTDIQTALGLHAQQAEVNRDWAEGKAPATQP